MRTILLPTDFSESSFNAALYAADLANKLHVPTIILYHSNTIPTRAAEWSILHEHTREILESFKQRMQPHIHKQTQIEIRTDELPVYVAIETITEQRKIDLIVMATTGKGTIERAIVGSNTVSVAKECSAPLLLIPKKAKFEEVKKLGFATDLKDVFITTPTETIGKFIELFNAQLAILNVSRSENTDPDASLELSALQLLFEKQQPEYHHIEAKDVVSGLMAFAIAHQIQLIAVVPKKHGFLEGIFHHGMTTDIAYHTYLPVLLLKPPSGEKLS
jgi:nucleotide-binding universal stress UspA family protein